VVNAHLDQACIDRILAAVEHVPVDLDRGELLSELEGIRSLYKTGVDFRHQPTKRAQNTAKIIAAAKSLKTLIKKDWELRWHVAMLNRLIADAPFPPALKDGLGAGQVSAFDNLIGKWLRSTFERHFNIEASYTRDPWTNEVTGAFIDFAAAALTELGVTNLGNPYSRSSIASAVSKNKPLKT
jgi:hypothetical protein